VRDNLTLSDATHAQRVASRRSAARCDAGPFIGSDPPLTRPVDPGPGRPFQTTPDVPTHRLRPIPVLPELVVHLIDGHGVALNPAAIDFGRLEGLHAKLHGWTEPELRAAWGDR
jgi:hypothetical protein